MIVPMAGSSRAVLSRSIFLSTSSSLSASPLASLPVGQSLPLRLQHSSRQSANGSTRARPFSTGGTPPARSPSSLTTAIVVGLVASGAYALGSLYPPALISLLKPRPLAPSPSMESEEGKAHMARIEEELLNLPLVKELLQGKSAIRVEARDSMSKDSVGSTPGANPSTRGPSVDTQDDVYKPHYVISRPYKNFPPEKLLHSLTAGSLRGPGKFATSPLILSKTDVGVQALGGHKGDAFAFLHLGESLCGHNGIIHGGLLATVCDEALARTAFISLPNHVGVTAKLELDYKAPTHANQFVVVETVLEEIKGRKAVVRGVIKEVATGKTLVEARAIFVEPRFAKWLDASLVKDALDAKD